ncbi:hypothetical protein RND81_06G178700 [Saponaria officinalis]|uniref:Aminotransferase-like plant mobile domain-containing protein n=1 Tax=Saponaria officinalis TaxID=3572 RepID=A0AAW1KE92_SAPOF
MTDMVDELTRRGKRTTVSARRRAKKERVGELPFSASLDETTPLSPLDETTPLDETAPETIEQTTEAPRRPHIRFRMSSARTESVDPGEHLHPTETSPHSSDDVTYEDEDEGEGEGVEAEGPVGGLEGHEDPLAASSTFLVRRGPDGKFISSSEASSNSVAGGRRKRSRGHSDDSWTLREAAPGGPIIPSILPSFTSHVAYRLWTDPTKDRGVLTCYQRASLMERLRRDWLPPQAVMERILGIPINGRICSITGSEIVSVCDLLGMTSAELERPLKSDAAARIVKGNGVLVDVVRLYTTSGSSSLAHAQGYLLTFLGSSLFVDKSGDRVRTGIATILMDYARVKDYAWGAGYLAYLYRQLGIASRADCKVVAGCMTLLQAFTRSSSVIMFLSLASTAQSTCHVHNK